MPKLVQSIARREVVWSTVSALADWAISPWPATTSPPTGSARTEGVAEARMAATQHLIASRSLAGHAAKFRRAGGIENPRAGAEGPRVGEGYCQARPRYVTQVLLQPGTPNSRHLWEGRHAGPGLACIAFPTNSGPRATPV